MCSLLRQVKPALALSISLNGVAPVPPRPPPPPALSLSLTWVRTEGGEEQKDKTRLLHLVAALQHERSLALAEIKVPIIPLQP